MTSQQEAHLERVKTAFAELLDAKYRAGQEKHGGNLFDKTPQELIDEAIYEAIDQAVYLITLKDKL